MKLVLNKTFNARLLLHTTHSSDWRIKSDLKGTDIKQWHFTTILLVLVEYNYPEVSDITQQGFMQDQIIASHTCVWWPEMDYKHTCDTIYTHFWGITDNIHAFGRLIVPSNFLPVLPYFYPSTMVFTHPNDGWTVLCIKLCHSVLFISSSL